MSTLSKYVSMVDDIDLDEMECDFEIDTFTDRGDTFVKSATLETMRIGHNLHQIDRATAIAIFGADAIKRIEGLAFDDAVNP